MNYDEIHRIKKHYNGKILTRLFVTVSRNHTTLYLSINIFNAYKYTLNIYITHTYNIRTYVKWGCSNWSDKISYKNHRLPNSVTSGMRPPFTWLVMGIQVIFKIIQIIAVVFGYPCKGQKSVKLLSTYDTGYSSQFQQKSLLI